MKTILYKIPSILLYSRLVVAVIIIVCSFTVVNPIAIIWLSIYAILSDIFDGIIARKLKISNPEMRRLDTKIDTVFWFSCLLYICLQHTQFLFTHILQVFILVCSEVFVIIVGKLKFGERISFHTILSKIWALSLLWFFIDINLYHSANFSFNFSFWYGLLVQAEIVLIALILKQNQTDVPSLWKAVNFKKGHEIKRNAFFNG